MVNIKTTDLGPEVVGHAYQQAKGFRIFIVLKMTNRDLLEAFFLTLIEEVMSSSMFMKTRLCWSFTTLKTALRSPASQF